MSTLTSMNQPAYLVSPNGTKFTNTTNIPKELITIPHNNYVFSK